MTEPAFIINGTRYPMPESFTLGELYKVKQAFGVDADDLGGDVKGKSTELMCAMLYIVMHRADPSVTTETIMEIDLASFEQDTPTPAAVESGDDAGPPIVARGGSGGVSSTRDLATIRAGSGSRAS